MQFVLETRIAAPPATVFAFHESPGALERLTPPGQSVRVVSGGGSLRPGSRVVLRTAIGPIPITWVAEHTEYEPPHLFADRQVSGPFAAWYHRHRFLDDGQGGTLLRDEVEYRPHGGFLGAWLGGPLVRRMLTQMFAHRHAVTRKLVESGQFGPVLPGAGAGPSGS